MKEIKVGKTIKGLSNEITRFVNDHVNDGDGNFTMIQFHFIAYIGRNSKEQPVYQRDIEANFNIRRSTATGILQRLEKNNLITRQAADTDGRLKRIVLTPAGQVVFETKKKKLDQVNDILLQGVTTDELANFYNVVEKIYLNLATQKNKMEEHDI